MAKKQRLRYKDRSQVEPSVPPELPIEVLRRRRTKRLILVGVVAAALPLFEVIAYQFRAITVTIENRAETPITRFKMVYTGGSTTIDEIRPGATAVRVIRPNYQFGGGEHFSTYHLELQFTTGDGSFFRQVGRAGTLDYSARERYVIEAPVPGQPAQLKHSTSPGFPLGAVRDLIARLGFG